MDAARHSQGRAARGTESRSESLTQISDSLRTYCEAWADGRAARIGEIERQISSAIFNELEHRPRLRAQPIILRSLYERSFECLG